MPMSSFLACDPFAAWRAMWLFGLLFFACILLRFVDAVLWRDRRRDSHTRRLPPPDELEPDMEKRGAQRGWNVSVAACDRRSPGRITHAFDGVISDDVASKLVKDGRFRDRLSALLAEIYVCPMILATIRRPIRAAAWRSLKLIS